MLVEGHSDSRLGENYSCSGEKKLFHRNAINLNDDATDRVSFRSLPGEMLGMLELLGGGEASKQSKGTEWLTAGTWGHFVCQFSEMGCCDAELEWNLRLYWSGWKINIVYCGTWALPGSFELSAVYVGQRGRF